MPKPVTAERLRELLHYDPETGVLTWRLDLERVSAGSVTGRARQIRIDGGHYRTNHIIYFWMTGDWPQTEINPINKDPKDHRWNNLQLVPQISAPDNLTAEYLRRILQYDPETGLFTWRVDRSSKVRAGMVASNLGNRGYIRIVIDYKHYLASRLAYLYRTGEWPPFEIDHKNHNTTDNRWHNLRPATSAQQKCNKRTARKDKLLPKGVGWWNTRSCYRAYIQVDGSYIHLGYFNNAEDAHNAYMHAAQQHFGEFACWWE